ncbi:MAG TPA: mechanosensitive ion channel family protein [Actinomycetota bacterium]|nr:mechanosensitive ion channel family protein [Actinomycetota bacterium]
MLFQTIAEATGYSFAWLQEHGPRIAVLLALGLVVSWSGRAAVGRFQRRLEGQTLEGGTGAVSLHRTTTLVGIAASVLRATVWGVILLMILGELGFDLGPLLAGAGVVGIALGFGAQSLVKDFLAGFFILLENQFGVGESVDLSVTGGSVAGRIEALTLRSTAVRGSDGTLTAVPNGNIQFAANRSRGVGRVVVEVTVPSDLDVSEVRRRLDGVVGALRSDAQLQARLASGPETVDIESRTDELLVTVAAETRPSRRDEVEAEIRRRLERELDPRRTVVADDR